MPLYMFLAQGMPIFLCILLFSILGYGTFKLGKFNFTFTIVHCDCRKLVLVRLPVILRGGGSMRNRFGNVDVANMAKFWCEWKTVYFSWACWLPLGPGAFVYGRTPSFIRNNFALFDTHCKPELKD